MPVSRSSSAAAVLRTAGGAAAAALFTLGRHVDRPVARTHASSVWITGADGLAWIEAALASPSRFDLTSA